MVYLQNLGILNALGDDHQTIMHNMLRGDSPGMKNILSPVCQRSFIAGVVDRPLPAVPKQLKQFDCRNNQLALAALEPLREEIETVRADRGADRIGVVMGTSTSGIAAAEEAMLYREKEGRFPPAFDYKQQEPAALAEFVAEILKVEGPAYTISTACSSSGKVFASARELLRQNLCDLVVVGGVDSLCELTLSGFASLEAVSDERTNPFSRNRKGINIGEGAAIFTMTRDPSTIALLGVGESSDAHHMSAPHPEGRGAEAAMRAALQDAGLGPEEIDYVNLHATGTPLNDSMESHAMHAVFSGRVMASSSKPLTGHTLGAAGATEAALCWLLLKYGDRKHLIPHLFDGETDPQLSPVRLADRMPVEKPVQHLMSNSFAFGGNNVSVIVGLSD